jgi:hypothetical protein
MDKFLDEYNQTKLNQEDLIHLNRPIISNEIKAEIKNLPTKKNLGPDDFMVDFKNKPLKN